MYALAYSASETKSYRNSTNALGVSSREGSAIQTETCCVRQYEYKIAGAGLADQESGPRTKTNVIVQQATQSNDVSATPYACLVEMAAKRCIYMLLP